MARRQRDSRRDSRRIRPGSTRHYPRTARLNTLLHQIVADYLELIDDDRLGLVTVTGLEVDADLNRAQVYISALADESEDEVILAALEDYRKPIQAEIARSARLRKTPEVAFCFDPAVRAGARIEDILASLPERGPEGTASLPERGQEGTASEEDSGPGSGGEAGGGDR
jgi:ribosome-binding factor A